MRIFGAGGLVDQGEDHDQAEGDQQPGEEFKAEIFGAAGEREAKQGEDAHKGAVNQVAHEGFAPGVD